MRIPMLKIRRSWDRLIFNMGMPILIKRHLYIKTPHGIAGVQPISKRVISWLYMHYSDVIMSATASQNNQPHDCLLKLLFRRRSKTSKLRVTGLCAGNSPVTGEFPAQRVSNAENASIWWRHHGKGFPLQSASNMRSVCMLLRHHYMSRMPYQRGRTSMQGIGLAMNICYYCLHYYRRINAIRCIST